MDNVFHGIRNSFRQIVSGDDGSPSLGYFNNLNVSPFLAKDGVSLFYASPLVQQCLLLQANSVAQVSLMVTDEEGNRLPEAPPFNLRRPNRKTSMFTFLQTLIIHLRLFGHVYIDKRDMPELHLLQAQGMTYYPSKTRSGLGVYVDARGNQYLEEEIIHIKDIDSKTPRIISIADSIATTVEGRQFVREYFQNGAFLGGLLESDATMQALKKDAESILDKFMGRFAKRKGGGDRFGVGLMPKGWSFKQIQVELGKLGMTDIRQDAEVEVLQIFGTSRYLVENTLSNATGLGTDLVRETRRNWWETTLLPLYQHIAEELSWGIYGDRPRRLAFDFTGVAALATNLIEVIEWAEPAYRSSGITRSEFRRALGYEPNYPEQGDDDPHPDTVLIRENTRVVPIDQIVTESQPPTTETPLSATPDPVV